MIIPVNIGMGSTAIEVNTEVVPAEEWKKSEII
jgi:sulfur carrier protein ThiS